MFDAKPLQTRPEHNGRDMREPNELLQVIVGHTICGPLLVDFDRFLVRSHRRWLFEILQKWWYSLEEQLFSQAVHGTLSLSFSLEPGNCRYQVWHPMDNSICVCERLSHRIGTLRLNLSRLKAWESQAETSSLSTRLMKAINRSIIRLLIIWMLTFLCLNC